ncbi:hypothetical protein [Kaistia nematophila]|uniref:Uncharacterized protein n=1 Tax=Kaistia nematophila TaxID=2994654 RepID=A0A9X3E3E5_9HYPH|nr:hypothetical protein [Kaistia nematophila]MCX5570642.1 hypothetical protein [Kaistia nematophila]
MSQKISSVIVELNHLAEQAPDATARADLQEAARTLQRKTTASDPDHDRDDRLPDATNLSPDD